MAAPAFKNSVHWSHHLISQVVGNGDWVIDATCGNGKDTLFLARLVGESGRVYAFDIQDQAISNTSRLVKDHGLTACVDIIQGDHRFLSRHVGGPVRAVMFNLGYLPGGNKELITKPDSTVPALGEALSLLAVGGMITLVAYTGHPGGKEELQAVLQFVSTLDQTRFSVMQICYPNQVNDSPQLIAIEKLGSDAK